MDTTRINQGGTMNFLAGYKTYIVVVVAVIFNGLVAMGYIPASSLALVNTILGFLGLGAIRAGISGK